MNQASCSTHFHFFLLSKANQLLASFIFSVMDLFIKAAVKLLTLALIAHLTL